MKALILITIAILPLFCFGQHGKLIDVRDHQIYTTTEINGTLWMRDNLNFDTKLSFGLDSALQAAHPDLKGRWYHLNEIDKVCPQGWQLPKAEDWIAYFNYLAEIKETNFKLRSRKENVSLEGYEGKVDLFEDGNLLNILPTGIFEGSRFIRKEQADYWIIDLSKKQDGKSGTQNYKPVRVVYEGKSHIHLYNPFTNIHSHDHHLDSNDFDTLRRFMVRCVSYDKNTESKAD